MCFECGRYVDVRYYLSVYYQKRIVLEEVTCVVQRAGGAQYFRFFTSVFDVHAKLSAISEGVDNGFGLMMKIHNNVAKAKTSDVFRNIADQRLSEKWDCRLGPIDR
jgi:hypothetical protein